MKRISVRLAVTLIDIEILTRTFVFSSINYEYSLSRNTSLGVGIGLICILGGDILRDNNAAPEEGRYLDVGSTQMIYGNYFFGKRNHKVYLTGGLTNFLITSRNTYQSETELSRELPLDWNTGMGCQSGINSNFFRGNLLQHFA